MSDTAHLIRDGSGATLFDSTWPRCHSCGKQSPDVSPLRYVRTDGVRGMSYPDCAECRRDNAARLQRLGFAIRGERNASPSLGAPTSNA
jgi:hypothetical protein